jgi:beta-galactosidase
MQKIWVLALLALGLGSSDGNDAIYPAAPAAKTAIDFDNAGFLINGQRTVIMSGSIHYPRIPHELWADRLLRLKRCNFNTVQTYAFWNYSEPRKNQFDFTGDADISKFLSTAQELGLYATVRPGPYVLRSGILAVSPCG